MADFLFEIGLEEIPARMIAGAELELGKRITDLLTRERLLGSANHVTTFSTPRRLAVLVQGLPAAQADAEEKLTGPSWKVAFKDGAATPAAEAFAKKAGVAVEALEKITNAKGEYVGATVKREGRAATELLAAELPKEVLALYWAKNMYWRAGKPERFVRPVRWLVALFDGAIVPIEIAGIAAANTSRGHRILHGETPVEIGHASQYAEALRAAKVVVSVSERRQTIRKALDRATRAVSGARWREDEPLVETVTHLTEWPSVILGDFEPEYLALPEQVLVTVMRDHQKYFALEAADGKLAPHFLAVLNTEVTSQGAAIIRHGNARVLRARFKDAQFFWDFDQKTPLVDRVESLKSVTFHKDLGSYFDKSFRTKLLVDELAADLLRDSVDLNRSAAFEAAVLAKTDLTCELVKEFTELQGIIGGLYARSQGLEDKIANAIYSHYSPNSSEDRIPPTIEGQLLSIADKADSIAGMFGIGAQPTGSRDPFGLRRAASGIVRILAEGELPLGLNTVIELSVAQYNPELFPAWKGPRNRLVTDIGLFFADRVQFYLQDVRNFAYDIVNAVWRASVDDVKDAIARAQALTEVRDSEDFKAISGAFKRIKNIVRQAEEKGEVFAAWEDGELLSELPEAEEKALINAFNEVTGKVNQLAAKREYREAFETIATLRPAVDAFFERVMVMAPDPELRKARLGMIRHIREGFSGIADFSEIVTS
jgi:glycyl-tRNA synthetase beta chain